MRQLFTLFIVLAFASSYSQTSAYKRFGGTITVVNDEVVKFDNEILVLYDIEPKLRPIFEWGLLYPSMFSPAPTTANASGGIEHRVTVTEFKIFPSASPKIKTFQFVILQNDGSKPKLYHMELVNQTANWKMDILTFVRGSRIAVLKMK